MLPQASIHERPLSDPVDANVDTLVWYFAGIIGVLRKAMQTGADPRAYAAVDLLLELLRHWGRSDRIDDCSRLLAPLNGPKLLAAIGKAALGKGAPSFLVTAVQSGAELAQPVRPALTCDICSLHGADCQSASLSFSAMQLSLSLMTVMSS